MCATSSSAPFLTWSGLLVMHTAFGRYDGPCIAVTSDAALCCSGVCCGKLAQGCLLPTWCLPALQLQGATLGCISQ